ncbi:hypothetical protein RvY_14404 [Ramazzottius varieornatus]|uniref:Uncharacterized protein n=1 Tax=Ramazzottius varieornatus TaxID=947166 RepID=A0A1D1VT68_RAMVA|nr:hypothetical protein RvY_14404 [Ramazzottius varieornatus]
MHQVSPFRDRQRTRRLSATAGNAGTSRSPQGRPAGCPVFRESLLGSPTVCDVPSGMMQKLRPSEFYFIERQNVTSCKR